MAVISLKPENVYSNGLFWINLIVLIKQDIYSHFIAFIPHTPYDKKNLIIPLIAERLQIHHIFK